MLRRLLYTLLLMVCTSCAGTDRQGDIQFRGVNPIGSQWQQLEQGAIPQDLSLSLQVENAGASVKIRGGEVGIRYRGRKVAILTLQDKVKILGHKSSQVLLTVRLHVAHNSQAKALYETLRRGSVEGVSAEWDVRVRKGLFGGRIRHEAVALDELLDERALERVKEILQSVE